MVRENYKGKPNFQKQTFEICGKFYAGPCKFFWKKSLDHYISILFKIIHSKKSINLLIDFSINQLTNQLIN